MNLLIYIFSIILALGLNFIYKYENLDNLMFMLKPVTAIVQIFLGTDFVYYENIGFVNRELSISINRECSGINFFIGIFIMEIFLFTKKIKKDKSKIVWMICFFSVSYLITIFANASRIISSILVTKIILLSNIKQERIIHQSIGVFFYLTFFILIYYVLSKIIEGRKSKNE